MTRPAIMRDDGPEPAPSVHAASGRHPFAAVIKPTDRCNMGCRYCYATHRSLVQAMNPGVLEAVIAKVPLLAGPGRPLHFIWHGGEPLLLGQGFFERVVTLQEKHCRGRTYDNCVQTNGTLLTGALVRFFARRGFSVSLSLDGPVQFHDGNRCFPDGRGSHRQVLRAIDRLRQAGQLVGAVAVLTRQSAAQVEKLYHFMKQTGVQYRVNPVIAPTNADPEMQISPEEYGSAMQQLFDLWFFDNDPPHIDPIQIAVGNLISPSVWGCDCRSGCARDVLAINPDGKVYPCGQLAGHPEFAFGNILDDSPAEILRAPMARRIRKRPVVMRKMCSSCEFVPICNGGCMASAWLRNGSVEARDYFCEGRRAFFRHAQRRIAERVQQVCSEVSIDNPITKEA
jgi:uncharacterized protein